MEEVIICKICSEELKVKFLDKNRIKQNELVVKCAGCGYFIKPFIPQIIKCVNCNESLFVPYTCKYVECPICNTVSASIKIPAKNNKFADSNSQTVTSSLSRTFISDFSSSDKKKKSKFMIFCDENRSNLSKQFPDLSFGQITAKLSKMWNDHTSNDHK